MKKLSYIPILFVAIALFSSCSDSHWFDFTKSTGKIVRIERPLEGTFDTLVFNDNINVEITIGNEYKLELEGGENLLPGIETSVKDSTITFSNKNRFNWVRSYKPEINAYLTLPFISQMRYKSVGTITNTGTIMQPYLDILGLGGSGYINLTLNVNQLKVALVSGAIDADLKGNAGAFYAFNDGMGVFRCYELNTGFLYITNKAANNCYVTATNTIEYIIEGVGDIYLKGNPPNISGTASGGGELVIGE